MSDRPNILVLMTDQQRFDTIGALGNPIIRTPNLDRLVREGTAFTDAYSPSPECVPARCSMTYGQHPAQTKCYGNGQKFPTDTHETFMGAIQRAGYRTHGIGKYHFEHADHARGLEGNGFETRDLQEEIPGSVAEDDYLTYLRDNDQGHITDPHGVRGEMYYFPQPAQMPAKHHPTQWVGDRACDFVGAQDGEDRPWFCYTSFIHPHPPFAPPAPWHKLYRDLDMPLSHLPEGYESLRVDINHHQNRTKRYDRGFDLARLRVIRAYYYACISFIDFQVGRILDQLEATGQRENTLILFTSDHGELLGDFGCMGKRSYHDAAQRIPMLLAGPGVPQDRRCATPVSLIDLTKTCLAAGDASFNTHDCEGDDMVALANAGDQDRTLFSQLNRAERGLYTAINRDWKYVYSAPDAREFLFDRKRDSPETRDLVPYCGAFGGNASSSQVQAREALQSLRSQLHAHLESHGETAAVEGGAWKPYPKAEPFPTADTGLLYQDHPWADQHIPGYSD